jgi:glycosyltransferase involved in cell wall biosynthesis
VNLVCVIPALDEERAVGEVIRGIPPGSVRAVIVVDNGSRDRTAETARAAGALVVREPERGYGAACLRGIEEARRLGADAIVFLDADRSDDPGDLPLVIGPILEGRADLVIGSRVRGVRERGALLPQARVGNFIATSWIRLLHGVRFTDLGPFRAVTVPALERLSMADRDFGWTVEMQVRAARLGLRSIEVPVRYRKRIGTSKISGTLSGSIRAGTKILWVLFREVFRKD